MSRIRYYQINGGKRSRFSIKLEMVQYAMREGVSSAAGAYGTTRNTVRKWVVRYRTDGVSGLEDRSRRPKNSPGKMPRELEERVIALRERYPTFWADGWRWTSGWDVRILRCITS
jgi:transposase-like protein